MCQRRGLACSQTQCGLAITQIKNLFVFVSQLFTYWYIIVKQKLSATIVFLFILWVICLKNKQSIHGDFKFNLLENPTPYQPQNTKFRLSRSSTSVGQGIILGRQNYLKEFSHISDQRLICVADQCSNWLATEAGKIETISTHKI